MQIHMHMKCMCIKLLCLNFTIVKIGWALTLQWMSIRNKFVENMHIVD